jgi:hypothetical protein
MNDVVTAGFQTVILWYYWRRSTDSVRTYALDETLPPPVTNCHAERIPPRPEA